jgi:hypothetical protein
MLIRIDRILLLKVLIKDKKFTKVAPSVGNLDNKKGCTQTHISKKENAPSRDCCIFHALKTHLYPGIFFKFKFHTRLHHFFLVIIFSTTSRILIQLTHSRNWIHNTDHNNIDIQTWCNIQSRDGALSLLICAVWFSILYFYISHLYDGTRHSNRNYISHMLLLLMHSNATDENVTLKFKCRQMCRISYRILECLPIVEHVRLTLEGLIILLLNICHMKAFSDYNLIDPCCHQICFICLFSCKFSAYIVKLALH